MIGCILPGIQQKKNISKIDKKYKNPLDYFYRIADNINVNKRFS
jgi:hypothetical protein